MSPKEIVKAFYESDIANDSDLVSKFMHKECQLHWNSSSGYEVFDYDGLKNFFKNISLSYHSLKSEISHLLVDQNQVTIRYTVLNRLLLRSLKN